MEQEKNSSIASSLKQVKKCRKPEDTWIAPSTLNKYRTNLMLNNSLAGKKVEFIPVVANSKQITWYGCGPTVYDASHMGHARTYVAFDILRRVLSNYFHYDITMCMNITDIDDKIIKRSQELKQDYLKIAKYWEHMFWKDMLELNVLLPDVITRVSEFIPQILKFIQGILDNQFAYVSYGTVYFDTQAFRASAVHVYGRMEPFSINDASRAMEGEGELGIVTEKKCPLDFALWKKSKPNEPSWDSPWGPGRPGWHIECSTMASSVFGFPIDIHSGGIDLRFPHHDNELAQSEACYNKPQWINYFLHSGHLHIKGSKMSKSLKNFVTIQECLKSFSARTIRILVLMHKYDCPMMYSPDGESLEEANETDRQFINFFGVVQNLLREFLSVDSTTLEDLNLTKGLLSAQSWDEEDIALHEKIIKTQNGVDAALRDNIDTPTAFSLLRVLMGDTNAYIKNKAASIKIPLILKGAKYIFRLLSVVGLTNGNESDLDYLENKQNNVSLEVKLMETLSSFRQQIRSLSQDMLAQHSKVDGADKSQILQLLQICDLVRDKALPEIGILLEDSSTGSVWKKLSTKEIEKLKQRKPEEKQKQVKSPTCAKDHIPPELYFKTTKGDMYKAFDEDGLPTKTANGDPVSKTKRDKLKKILDSHSKKHQMWKESLAT